MAQNGTNFPGIILITVIGLLAFGVWYAWRIYRWPFPHGQAWLSVVVGCEATLVGMGVALWAVLFLRLGIDFWPALGVAILVPHGAFALTGAPMILYQIRKDGEQLAEAFGLAKRGEWGKERDDGDGPGGGNAGGLTGSGG